MGRASPFPGELRPVSGSRKAGTETLWEACSRHETVRVKAQLTSRVNFSTPPSSLGLLPHP